MEETKVYPYEVVTDEKLQSLTWETLNEVALEIEEGLEKGLILRGDVRRYLKDHLREMDEPISIESYWNI